MVTTIQQLVYHVQAYQRRDVVLMPTQALHDDISTEPAETMSKLQIVPFLENVP